MTKKTIALEALSDKIALLSAHIEAAGCRLMDMIVEFDQRCGWGLEGAKTCVQWLGWRLGWSPNTASERLRVGHALQELPVLHEALAAGRVSYSKLRAVTRVASPETEAEWLNIALNSTASQCEKIVRVTRRASEAENLVVENARNDARRLSTYYDANGMFVIEGRLPPEVGALVERALEATVETLRGEQKDDEKDPCEPKVTFGQQRADALVRMAQKTLRGDGDEPLRSADQYQVVVHVDANVLANPESEGCCELANGPALSAESLRRLTCDGSLVTMLHDGEGNILDVGRKTRVLNAALRRALEARDGGCQFPGCDCRHVDAHHIEHWAGNGETKLSNLLSLCRFHHLLVHEGGFSVTANAGGDFVFRRPNGSDIPRAATFPPLRGESTETLTLWNEKAGVLIDVDTNMPEWDGEIPQYAYIAEVMSELATRRSRLAD